MLTLSIPTIFISQTYLLRALTFSHSLSFITVSLDKSFLLLVLLLMLLALSLLITGIGFFNLRKKHRALLQALVEKSPREKDKYEISPPGSELQKAKSKLEDHLNFAQKFQAYILPSHQDLAQDFADQMVLFNPKEKAGGDFYWYLKFARSTSFLAVIDCTGHGVSGAFLSLLGHHLLHKIIQNQRITEPQQIIEQLHLELHKRIQTDKENNPYGMEIGLCRMEWIGEDRVYLTFAGAKSRLLYYDQDQLIELQGDKGRIGAWSEAAKREFDQQTILLQAGSKIYLFTDGLINLPNPDRKKFGHTRLHNLIQEIAPLPLGQQEELLRQTLAKHSQGTPQRDDMTLIGLEIKARPKTIYTSANGNGHIKTTNASEQDVSFNFFDYHAKISQNQVILSYKGPLTDILISQFSRDVRGKVMNNSRIGKKVFSIFMELAQNALYYSKEVNHFGNNDPVGTLVILNTDHYFKILTGNLINIDSVEAIRKKCELINSFDREELREYKRKLRQAPREGESRGAGIGMIQAALTASSPVDYTIREVLDDYAFFVISVKVEKKKKAEV